MSPRDLDTLLQLVGDKRRRRTIRHLCEESEGLTTIDELLDAIRENGSGTNDRDQLAIQLHHVHLPKLSEHGVIDFDPESGTIRYRPDTEIETLLDSLAAEPSPTHQ